MTNYDKEILSTLRELTDDERLDAREAARGVILREIGDRPERAQFEGVNVSEYPRWVRGLVALLMLTVFMAAAAPSLFRLYSAGRTYHLQGIDSEWQAAIVGVSTFLLAEFIIITSTLAASIFFSKGWHRALFAVPISLGLAVAFVGNWTVVQPHDLFSYLETFVPPLVVVFVSFVGERLVLDSMKQAHADEKAYQEALAEWLEQSRNVEHHPKWQVIYGRALLEKLRKVNAKGRGAKARKEFMAELNRAGWSALVRREFAIDAGEWLLTGSPQPDQEGEDPEKRPFGNTAPALVAPANGQMTGSANGHGTTATKNGSN